MYQAIFGRPFGRDGVRHHLTVVPDTMVKWCLTPCLPYGMLLLEPFIHQFFLLESIPVVMQETPEQRELRSEPRIPYSMNVTLQAPGEQREYVTENISYKGVFMLCPSPLALRTLVRFQTVLSSGEALQMLGLVCHRTSPEEASQRGVESGMGLRLFGVGTHPRDVWKSFVLEHYNQDPYANERIKQTEFPSIQVRYPSVDALRYIGQNEVAQGTLFVRSATLHAVGTRAWFETEHPETGKVLKHEVVVQEAVETPRADRGMTLEFVNPQEASHELMSL